MKFKLLITILVMLMVGSTAFAGESDPDTVGVVDTLDLVVSVDWGANTVTAELYCYTDYEITGNTIGFTWANSTAELTMTSASTAPLLDPITLKFLYEDNLIATTNANKRFLLGTTAFTGGVPGDDSGRRLWATYNFDMTWSSTDCVRFDTLKFSGSSQNLFTTTVDTGGGNFVTTSYYIEYVGETFVCNPTDVNTVPGDLPETYALNQNYPNPFNPNTEINFDIPTRSHTTLKVYNILGQEVETLVDEELSQGRYVAEWDASMYSSGIYFYKLNSEDFVDTKKMVLVK